MKWFGCSLVYFPIFSLFACIGLINGQAKKGGILSCTGNELQFEMPNTHVRDLVNGNLFTVQSLRIGDATGGSDCEAYPYPLNQVATSRYIAVPYTDQCDVAVREDLTREVAIHSATAYMTVLDQPATGAPTLRRFTIGLICELSLRARANTTTFVYGHVTVLPGISVPFDISFSVTSAQEVRPVFANLKDVNVHILRLELDQEFQATYIIRGNRCWATPTARFDSSPYYEVITSQGCNEQPEFVAQKMEQPYRHIIEIADFEFTPVSTHIYFHCDVNVCRKSDTQTTRCSEECKTSSLSRAAVKTNADFRLSSGRTVPNPDIPAQVIVGEDGAPTHTSGAVRPTFGFLRVELLALSAAVFAATSWLNY